MDVLNNPLPPPELPAPITVEFAPGIKIIFSVAVIVKLPVAANWDEVLPVV